MAAAGPALPMSPPSHHGPDTTNQKAETTWGAHGTESSLRIRRTCLSEATGHAAVVSACDSDTFRDDFTGTRRRAQLRALQELHGCPTAAGASDGVLSAHNCTVGPGGQRGHGGHGGHGGAGRGGLDGVADRVLDAEPSAAGRTHPLCACAPRAHAPALRRCDEAGDVLLPKRPAPQCVKLGVAGQFAEA